MAQPINGKAIAEKMLQSMARDVARLTETGITPTLGVIFVGNNSSSLSFIRQKEKAAETIGAEVILEHKDESLSGESLHDLIADYNTDPMVHGLIIQRPLPRFIPDAPAILSRVHPEKDVDGFVPNSKFQVPVALAVIEILKAIHHTDHPARSSFHSWLTSRAIVVVGRGETAGKPIQTMLNSLGCSSHVVHSKTPDPEGVIKRADIIVSCVGKERVIRAEMIKKGAALISVGICKDQNGIIHGDYENEEIADIASFYTPTPGGVGPVNVACLMKNLVQAAGNVQKEQWT